LSIKTPPSPRRGEVWLVNLDPTLGAEMKKVRPAIIISSNAIGILPVKLIAPITKWKEWFLGLTWLVPLAPDGNNGLTEESAVDTLQVRGVAVERFIEKKGQVTASQLEEIATAIAIVIEYQ
jgi:mRNA interferase MazF